MAQAVLAAVGLCCRTARLLAELGAPLAASVVLLQRRQGRVQGGAEVGRAAYRPGADGERDGDGQVMVRSMDQG